MMSEAPLTPHGRPKPNPSAALGFVLAVFALMSPLMPVAWFGCIPGFFLSVNGYFQTRGPEGERGGGLAVVGFVLNAVALSLPWALRLLFPDLESAA